MSLSGLLGAFLTTPTLTRATNQPLNAPVALSAPPAVRPFVAAALAAPAEAGGRGVPVLVVTATVREAEDLASELTSLLPPGTVALYPAWETLPHERLSPRSIRRLPSRM